MVSRVGEGKKMIDGLRGGANGDYEKPVGPLRRENEEEEEEGGKSKGKERDVLRKEK